MAAKYSNQLNLFNLTLKSSPVGADLIPLGDSAVTGTPLKQTTITDILALVPGGSSGTTWIATVSATNSASVAFANDLSATYDNYLVIGENIVAATTTVNLLLIVGTGSTPTYSTSTYSGGNFGFSSSRGADTTNLYCNTSLTTAFTMTASESGSHNSAFLSATSTNAASLSLNICNTQNATNYKAFSCTMGGLLMDSTDGEGAGFAIAGGGWSTATALTSLKLEASSGNLITGTFKLYGYQN